jgi:hypothetical protein
LKIERQARAAPKPAVVGAEAAIAGLVRKPIATANLLQAREDAGVGDGVGIIRGVGRQLVGG